MVRADNSRRNTKQMEKNWQNPLDEYLTERQVADLLQVSPRTVWELRKQGVLPAAQVGRSVRYSRRMIDDYMQRQMQAQDEASASE